jgi:hypothetical protein
LFCSQAKLCTSAPTNRMRIYMAVSDLWTAQSSGMHHIQFCRKVLMFWRKLLAPSSVRTPKHWCACINLHVISVKALWHLYLIISLLYTGIKDNSYCETPF